MKNVLLSALSVLAFSTPALAGLSTSPSVRGIVTSPSFDPAVVGALLRKPDLIATKLEVVSLQKDASTGGWKLKVKLTSKNQGLRDAIGVKIAAYANEYVQPIYSGTQFAWYANIPALKAGESKASEHTITIAKSYAGKKVDVKVKVDSCSGEEFVPEYCRVAETIENNNYSPVYSFTAN